MATEIQKPHGQPDAVLDTRGLYCPEPIMMMHNKVRDMATDQLLLVKATDPATERDIPQFCTFLGHELLQHEEVASDDGECVYHYLIKLG